jgi:hypothetical protein
MRQQLVEEWQECLYTTTNRDPDSKSDSYDPMQECFNVKDGAVASNDDTTEDDDNGAAPTPAVGGDPKTPEQGGQLDPPPP